MKTLPVLASIAAAVAAVVYFFSFQVAVSVLFAAGLLTIALSDYRSAIRPGRPARALSLSQAERLRLAA